MTAPNEDTAIELVGVEHAYRRTVALRGVSLRVDAGEVVAVTGPSGCGKSTALHVAAGILRPQGGVVRILGRDLADLDETARTHQGVGAQSQVGVVPVRPQIRREPLEQVRRERILTDPA